MSGARPMLLVVALALPIAIAGCRGADSVSLFRDDFESVCDGSPCGWLQVAGPSGAARYVESVPGDHGIELTGEGVAVSRLAEGDQLEGADPITSLEAHLVARCDARSSITVIVSVQGVTSSTPIDVTGTATFPPRWDGSRIRFPLLTTGATSSTQFNDVLAVVLHKEGPGTCEVDYVSLASMRMPFVE
ncbi:MAG: hypothetical protein U0234_25755 [Sandaracinus sp.]